jgi:uncharacterized protein (DUF2336 family)
MLQENMPDVNQPQGEFLSAEDVRLLMQDTSVESRITVARKISSSYTQQHFNLQEQLYAEQIFRLLVKDLQQRVRREVALGLQHSDEVPRDIILSLSEDEALIAIPILQHSPVLSDADLMRMIEGSHDIDKIESIAKRERVSERISHTLTHTHYPKVIKSLLRNPGAMIRQSEYEAIIQHHKEDQSILDVMAQRAALPLPIAERILDAVSEQAAQSLQRKYNLDIEKIRTQSKESMLMEFVSHNASDEEISEAIAQMKSFDRLTPSVLIAALCRGHLRFFEIGLARLANIPKSNARKLVRDRGAYGFEALYEKAEMPLSLYEAVKLLLDCVLAMDARGTYEAGSKLYIGTIIEMIEMQHSVQPVDQFSYLITLIKRSM